MKQTDELSRMRRFVTHFAMFVLFLICIVIFFFTVEIRHLNNQVQTTSATISQVTAQPIKIVNGKDGVPGVSIQGPAGIGLQGPAGNNGQNGQNVTPEQIAAAVAAYMQANPVVGQIGSTGISGQDGRTLLVRVTADCILQTKYVDDDGWTNQAQLPIPCDPNSDTQNVQPAS